MLVLGRHPEVKRRPVCLAVMPPFSQHAKRRDWSNIEEFYNPDGFFSAVHILSLGDEHSRSQTRFGSVIVHPLKPIGWLRDRSASIYFLVYHVAIASVCAVVLALRTGADILLQRYGGPLYHGVACVFAGRLLGRRSVITLQADYGVMARERDASSALMRSIETALWKQVVGKSSRIWAVSDSLVSFAEARGRNRSQVSVIPNKDYYRDKFQGQPTETEIRQIRHEVFGPQGTVDPRQIALTVARLIPVKNIQAMVDSFAMAAADRPGLGFVIVGAGPLEGQLKEQARNTGLEGRIRFVSFLPHSRLAILYRISYLLLFPSLSEGQGRVIIEAMAAGLPVIGSNYPPFTDVIVDGENGLLVDPSNTAQIADAIARLVDDRVLRDRLARACPGIASKYEVASVNRQEVEFFRSVLR